MHPNPNNDVTSQSITQQSKQATTENTDNLMTTRTQIVAGVILTILLLAAVGSAIGYSLKSNNRNDCMYLIFFLNKSFFTFKQQQQHYFIIQP